MKEEEGGAGGGIVANWRDRQARRRDGTTELEGREGVLAALSPKLGSNPRLIVDGAEVALAERNRERGVGTVAKKGKWRRVWSSGRGRGRGRLRWARERERSGVGAGVALKRLCCSTKCEAPKRFSSAYSPLQKIRTPRGEYADT